MQWARSQHSEERDDGRDGAEPEADSEVMQVALSAVKKRGRWTCLMQEALGGFLFRLRLEGLRGGWGECSAWLGGCLEDGHCATRQGGVRKAGGDETTEGLGSRGVGMPWKG